MRRCLKFTGIISVSASTPIETFSDEVFLCVVLQRSRNHGMEYGQRQIGMQR